MIGAAVRGLYDRTLRPFLPRKVGIVDGVLVRSPRLLDRTWSYRGHEEPLCAAIRRHVRPGDDVTVVGGGIGVSTVVAARRVAPAGSVVSYEASPEYGRLVSDAISLNDVGGVASVRVAVVSEARSVYGDAVAENVVPPEQLPECDVLVLDCEGAEVPILQQLTQRPRTLIVESHGVFDSPTRIVRERIASLGYEIVSETAEDAEKDVFVLVGERAGGESR